MPRSDCHPTRATWGARCGKSARRVLRGGTGTSDLVARLVPTHHNIDHDLLMKAVRKHAPDKWIVLYIERWLKAPAQDQEGNQTARERGTPQGGVISPLLANLFLHYTFDLWMLKKWKHLPFERYADDIIVHCRGRWEANLVRAGVENRLRECDLELHSEKTKLVYCKDSNRQESHPHEKFDFLGSSVLQKHTDKEFIMN